MIKCIVSDLDGTLLNQGHMLGKRNAQAVIKAQEAGYEFIVATGRHWGSVDPILAEHGIQCRCILLNGAIYQDMAGNVKKEICLDNERARKIMKLLEKNNIHAHMYTSKGTATAHPEKLRQEFIERIQRDEHISREEVERIVEKSNFCKFDIHIDSMASYFASEPTIYKIEAFSNNDEAMKQVRIALEEIEDIVLSDSIGHNFELTDIKAQKGFMLMDVIKELGYTKEEVIVFGDSMNDISMMKLFPNSYAMENSSPLILEAASFQTGKNTEDAVAYEIERLLTQKM